VIVSFGDKTTADLYHGERRRSVRRFPSDVRRVALRTLDVLNGASDLNDLRSPPGNRLEMLRGDWFGYHSIRVNDRWRLVFRWTDGNAHDVTPIDYH
jgi:proteic killer suppression protein